MRGETVRHVITAMLAAIFGGATLSGAAGCGGRALPQAGDEDAGVSSDAPVTDARATDARATDARATDAQSETDGMVTGRPCDSDGGCGLDYTCWLAPPGGYCLYGPPHSCRDSSECPSGTACSPLPLSQISGVCLVVCTGPGDCRPRYRCDYVELFPGETGTPRSPVPVCWTAPVCTYGMDQTCNDSPVISSIHGYCHADGTCTCKGGFEMNPATGKCR